MNPRKKSGETGSSDSSWRGRSLHSAVLFTWIVIIVGASLAFFFRSALAQSFQLAVLATICYILIACAVPFFFLRRLDASLATLLDTVKRIREGDLSARARLSSNDELGGLAASINQMAETLLASLNELKDVHASIAVNVEKRTIDLLKLVEYLKKEVAEHKESERKLKESEARHRDLLLSMPDPLFMINLEGALIFANPALERVAGFDAGKILSMSILDLVAPEYVSRFSENIQKAIDGRVLSPFDAEIIDTARKRVWMEIQLSPINDSSGTLTGIQGLARDTNEEKNLKMQLFQAQKMEAIGTFAEGIAHDFNTALTVILGAIDLAKMDLPPEHPAYSRFELMASASEQAKSLVGQLLQFGRPDSLEAEIISINKTVDEAGKLLEVIIPGRVELSLKLSDGPCTIRANPTLLLQIITNLSINARDAMPESGTLTIETSVVSLERHSPGLHVDASPGRYCLLRISDTGSGMSPETIERIFDPFFTTKDGGKGTGLGLSVVYNIVRGLEGWIHVLSTPGEGSTFEVYLPESPL
jgi:two-component system, cell cycle sensor histidine kinase and response regulator CckA